MNESIPGIVALGVESDFLGEKFRWVITLPFW